MSLPRRTRPPRSNGEKRRRDPRAERNALAGEVIAREEAEPSAARTRRDPRAERGPATRTGEYPRLDRARPLRLVEDTAAPERPETETGPQPIVINEPACWVLAVPEMIDGRLSEHDRDVFGAARRLADANDGAVVAVVFDGNTDLGGAGADRVMRFDAVQADRYAWEWRSAAVRTAVEMLKPRHILFPDNDGAGGDLGRRVAAALGEIPATRVQSVTPEHIVSRGDGEAIDYRREPPRLILMAPEAADPVEGSLHEARPVDPPDCAFPDAVIEDRGLLPADPATVPLAEAEFIAAAGNGVKDWPAFHAMAAALGATEGASRPVCDAGALPRDRQIGASGTLVSARCYLALGISGAPQHLQGITDCEHVIAVNADAGAEILKRADLGIVADVQEVMPALTRLLERRSHDS